MQSPLPSYISEQTRLHAVFLPQAQQPRAFLSPRGLVAFARVRISRAKAPTVTNPRHPARIELKPPWRRAAVFPNVRNARQRLPFAKNLPTDALQLGHDRTRCSWGTIGRAAAGARSNAPRPPYASRCLTTFTVRDAIARTYLAVNRGLLGEWHVKQRPKGCKPWAARYIFAEHPMLIRLFASGTTERKLPWLIP